MARSIALSACALLMAVTAGSKALAMSETPAPNLCLESAVSVSQTLTNTFVSEISTGSSSSSTSTSTSTPGSSSTSSTVSLQNNRCARPVSSAAVPTVTDCLFILQVSTMLRVCDPQCVCAPGGNLPPSATDALICLKVSTGQAVPLNCPCSPALQSE